MEEPPFCTNMDLIEFFQTYPKVAVAFSGGTDSSFLLYQASKMAAEVSAYYVESAFQPAFEKEDAMRIASVCGVELHFLKADILSVKEVTNNPANRCYYCKIRIFETIKNAAVRDGFTVLLDGTNASDDASDRPGMKALEELSVLSPLRICGYTKEHIREESRAAGLFTADKPAYACLATRIATGETITAEKLRATEEAENFLYSLGFRDFRVRRMGDTAKLQLKESQFTLALQHREEIAAFLGRYYCAVCLDLVPRDSQ